MKLTLTTGNEVIFDAAILDDDLLNGGELFIGRDEDCHIKLDSFQISRHHAKIYFSDNKLWIEKISNQGNIKVDGNFCDKSILEENSFVEIQEYNLKFTNLSSFYEEKISPNLDSDIENFGVTELLQENGIESAPLEQPVEELEATDVVDSNDDFLNEEPVESNEIDDDFLSDSEGDEDQDDNDEVNLDNADEFNDELGSENNFSDDGFEANKEEAQEDPFRSGEDSDFAEEDGFAEEGGFGDDGFGEDGGFGDDGFGEDSDEATQVLTSFANFTLSIHGEFAPFDRYVIEKTETKIGRNKEDCEIYLDDPEVSKVHAIIKKSLAACILIDNGSSNGIIYNGERVNQAELKSGDEFLIGDTSFSVGVSSDIIEAEKDILMPVADNQEVEIEEIVEEEVDFDEFGGEDGEFDAPTEEKSFIKKIWADKRKRLYLIVGIVVFLLVMLDTSEETSTPQEKPKTVKKEVKKEDKPKFSNEVIAQLEQNYALAEAKWNSEELSEAKQYIEAVLRIDPSYKDAQTLKKLINEGLAELTRLKREEQEAKERRERQLKVQALVEKAKKAVERKEVEAAKGFFGLIYEIDPENIDVPPLKLEIEAYEAEEARKKQEEEIEKARRKSFVDKLAPGKSLYIRGEWYKAIDKLDKYIRLEGVDEDLLKEATQMLEESKSRLVGSINPLLSKARSFKQGQDLKQAYETYGEVLKYDPSNEEALNERDTIFKSLRSRSKKLYREALISESLSLFDDAREKFKEVQQVSPINSEYYNKATDKLKNYLE